MPPSRKNKSKTQVFIVEDHPIFREGLSEYIKSEEDLDVCGSASSAAEALELIEKLMPDLAIIDIMLKEGMNGLDLAKQVHSRWPNIKMLVISMYKESLYAERAMYAGASGYLYKEEEPEKVIEAIRTILDDKVYISHDQSDAILRNIFASGGKDKNPPWKRLSDRGLEIFCLIGQGLSTKEIAKKLCLSPKTVETHKSIIKEKLNLKNATELTLYAIKMYNEKEIS